MMIKKGIKLILVIFKLFRNLKIRRQYQFIAVLFLMVSSALLEAITLASVIPLIGSITNKSEIEINKIFSYFVGFFKLDVSENTSLAIVIFFGIFVTLSGFIRILNIYASIKYSSLITNELTSMVYSNLIYKPYQFHTNTNSSNLVACITNYMQSVYIVFANLFQFLSSSIIALILISTLFIINFKITIYLIFIFSTIYLIIIKISNKRISKNSSLIARTNASQIKSIQEVFGSIRDIIINKSQPIFINDYISEDYIFRIKQAENFFLGSFPKYLIETVGLLLLSIFFISSIIQNSNFDSFAYIGVLAFGAQKLLPAFQQMFSNLTAILGNYSAILKVLDILIYHSPKNEIVSSKYNARFSFNQIELRNLNFFYNSKLKILKNISLNFKKGDSIALIGQTGSGKSTLIDIILGLLRPDSGEIVINSKINLHKRNSYIENWHELISHVPQKTYFLDKTINENIAFGISPENVNINKIIKAAKIAQIHDFIDSLPEKYNTKIGERGTLLSGGQLQRIAIARAIYRDRSILILDEATSALDKKTEKKLLDNIFSICKNKTIVLISHNYSALKYCDRLLEIKNGEMLERSIKDYL